MGALVFEQSHQFMIQINDGGRFWQVGSNLECDLAAKSTKNAKKVHNPLCVFWLSVAKSPLSKSLPPWQLNSF
jgi:hypothetical protein